MGFKRVLSPSEYPTGKELTKRCVAIGFRFAERPVKQQPNIEETLVAASIEGVSGDYRMLSLLVDWFDLHSARINADHLFNLAKELKAPLVKKFWIACAHWKSQDSRFKRLRELDDGKRLHLIESDDFQLKRHGEDLRFKNTPLIVHAKVLRNRPTDIDSAEQIARQHRAFHYRILIGPSYRADLMALLERRPDLTAADLARSCYSSFSAAWQAKQDFELIKVPASNC